MSIFKRILKWAAIGIASLIGIFLVVCTLIVWILTPSRLTPLVCNQASGLIDGEVTAHRVELTFWSTFPEMTLDVDSLCVISHALSDAPDSLRRDIPAGADSLMSIASFHAGINVLPLFTGRIALYDVLFHHPQVNLVQLAPGCANYLIFPESSDATEPAGDSSLALPRISISRFAVTDAVPLRYRSVTDSLDFSVALSRVDLVGSDAPRYTLAVSGLASSPMLREFDFSSLSFGADGVVRWDCASPFSVALSDFTVGVDSCKVTLSAEASFCDSPQLRSFSAVTAPVSIASLLPHLPAQIRHLASPLHTSMAVTASAQLLRPWCLSDTLRPAFRATLSIPPCSVEYENWKINDFALEASARFDGADPAASVIDISQLQADGDGISLLAHLSAADFMADPLVSGHFEGNVNLASIPATLRELIPGNIAGRIAADTDITMRLSYLSRNNFHRINARGKFLFNDIDATVTDFGRAYIHRAEADFGSNSRFVSNGHKIDSLLTVSLKADTLAAQALGMDLQLKGLRLGGGSVNKASSSDTTEINPFGATIAFEKLSFDSPADTLRARLRNASASVALRRFQQNARLPQVDMKVSVGGLAFGQALTKIALREADVDVTVHMRPPRRILPKGLSEERRRRLADSIAALQQVDDMRFPLDSTDVDFLRRWNFSGHIHAGAGRLVTPAFPLRNRLSHIDLHFNQDSIRLSNLACTAGQSDFLLNGTVSNLRRALTGRRGNNLGIHLTVSSDTINVNEIVRAIFAGGALAQQADSAMVWSDADDVADDRIVAAADTVSVSGPVLLPRNIDAQFSMRADNVLYSDLELHDFRGDLLMYDGALNLRDLSAATDVGSIDINGLYSAPSPSELQFGLGLRVDNFRLDGLTSLVPAIDSLMPVMRNFAGTVNADVAVTTDITPQMDIDIPSLRAAIKIEGDSLVLIDPDTFHTLSKWLFFRDKQKNYIDHMAVEVVIDNSTIELYPFMFDIDRYRLGVMGHNDLAMNLNYHVSVLKSPIPFKFGINIKGTPDNIKIRLGGAKFKERMVVERQNIADNTRINIVQQMESVFRKGISRARLGRLGFTPADTVPPSPASATQPQVGTHLSSLQATSVARPSLMPDDFDDAGLTVADSLRLIRQGLIQNPDTLRFPVKSTHSE